MSGDSPIWNVPHRRNVYFAGRSALLEDLKRSFRSGLLSNFVQAVVGLGGVGKTQLAVEYAYSHRNDYDITWWIDAERTTHLETMYAALAGEMGIKVPQNIPLADQCSYVRQLLEQGGRWLLIFDNAPNRAALKEFIPRLGNGHTLITTRDPIWSGTAVSRQVAPFERSDSVNFLLARTGESNRIAADRLADAMGDLPLALEQAGAYIEETSGTLLGYIDLFRERRTELLKRGQPSTDYPHSVATTWELSHLATQQACPAAGQLMNLFAFLSADGFLIQAIGFGAKFFPEPLATFATDAMKLDEAIAALRRFSLIGRTKDSLRVHKLVQAVAKDSIPLAQVTQWAEVALSVVNNVFPSVPSHPHMWAWASAIYPHAIAVAFGVNHSLSSVPALRNLLNNLGVYLASRASLADAKNTFSLILQIVENQSGKDHLDTTVPLKNIARVMHEQGDLLGAKEHLERALRIVEPLPNEHRLRRAELLLDLGIVLQEYGDFAGARARIVESHTIMEAIYGADTPRVVPTLGALAVSDRLEGHKDSARIRLTSALNILLQDDSKDMLTIASVRSNLGLVLMELGHLAEARSEFEGALAIKESAFGRDHPQVASARGNMAGVYILEGDLVKARECIEVALETFEAVYGPAHPNVARALFSLATITEKEGDQESADKIKMRSIEIFRLVFGTNFPASIQIGDFSNWFKNSILSPRPKPD